MSLYIITFFLFCIVIAVMAVGVIFGNRAIKGSCGGLNAIDGLQGSCDICGWTGDPGTVPGDACPDGEGFAISRNHERNMRGMSHGGREKA
jgi:hypothetical protein